MATTNIKATFQCDIKKVWNTVTSLDNYSWISNISKIEILSDTQFSEYTKDGYTTRFTITKIEPYERWEFDVENDNVKGHWIGLFSQNGSETTIDFTEYIVAKKLLMKPFIKGYLRKQQALYVTDLEKALQWQIPVYQSIINTSLLVMLDKLKLALSIHSMRVFLPHTKIKQSWSSFFSLFLLFYFWRVTDGIIG